MSSSQRIQGYLVNPVESRVASLEQAGNTGHARRSAPADVARVSGFTAMDEETLNGYCEVRWASP